MSPNYQRGGGDICDGSAALDATTMTPATERICIVGSGNWGSAIATILGRNAARLPWCHDEVRMWVFEETVTLPEDGAAPAKLSEVINARHENVKYLPGVKLPPNVRAVPDLAEACRDATLLIFVLPHQFLPRLLPVIAKGAHPAARGVSLIKGLDFDPTTGLPVLISAAIAEAMGPGFRCGVLMGANIASEVARRRVCESTLAADFGDADTNARTLALFHEPPHFRVTRIADVAGAEACGALKNVVALGAGFVDGLEMGGNAKAALLRVGLLEMRAFCARFFTGVAPDTFLESCGVADLVTTCYGGRNRRCAEAFARACAGGRGKGSAACAARWGEIERAMLSGQKLQGTLAAQEVYALLERRGLLDSFPLFRTIYEIAFTEKPVERIADGIYVKPPAPQQETAIFSKL